MLRVKCVAGIAVGLLAGMIAFVSPARATTLIILKTSIPGNPILPGDLVGTPQFWASAPTFDPRSIPGNPIIGPLSGDQTFFFEPPDPCFGATSCQIKFRFGVTIGTVSIFAVAPFVSDPPPLPTDGLAPMLLIGTLIPGDPCFNGATCHASGPIVEYDAPIQIGTWDVTIEATPLPAALPLFATGLGALGLLGWRRKRKAQAAA